MTLTAGFGGKADTALRYFRSDVPARGLRRYGWTVTVEPLVICEADDGRLAPWNGHSRPAGDYPKVMVLRCTNDFSWAETEHTALADDVARARDAGQTVILDIDDDLWHVPDWSPAVHGTRGQHPAIDLLMLNKLVGAVNAVSVSTPRIAQVVADQCPSANITVLRNGIDLLDFHPHEPTEGRPLRVGWMGGAQFHGPHLRTMLAALDTLPAHNAEFIHLGVVPSDETASLHDEIKDAAPGIRIGWVDWLDYSKLRQALTFIDIGIIPRVPSEFNEGQSTSSGMAYAAAGIPFLVAPSSEYRGFAEEGAGTICETVDDWRAGLDLLLGNRHARESAATHGYRAVCHHSVAEVGGDWHNFLGSRV